VRTNGDTKTKELIENVRILLLHMNKKRVNHFDRFDFAADEVGAASCLRLPLAVVVVVAGWLFSIVVAVAV
jgi:hypothetical protein